MVRRWSYLNSLNNTFFNQYTSLNFVYYEQSFKNNIVFRKDINFISTISRKSWSRRKHLTNWIIYQNVLTDWSREYIFFKKYHRFTVLFQMFSNSFLSYNMFLIKKLNSSSTVGSEKLLFSSLTSRIIRYGTNNSINFYTFLKNYRNVNWLYVTTPVTTSLTNTLVTPIIYTSQTTFNQTFRNTSMQNLLLLIHQTLFQITLSKMLDLYKVTILLNVLNSK